MVSRVNQRPAIPPILPIRERAAVIRRVLEKRLETVLPVAMREAEIDMWLILCQEDDLDPVFRHLVPLDAWCPILQMLIFYDRGATTGDGGPKKNAVERINLSMTKTNDLYERPWNGQRHEEQWPLLRAIIEERAPRRIGINTGAVQWAAGGLTHNLHTQLIQALAPRYRDRLTSAEPLATRFLAALTDDEVELFEQVVKVAHALLGACYTRDVITPGTTTLDDLEWHYWQLCADRGLNVSFKPFFYLIRSDRARATFGEDDRVIRPGDFVRSDVGIKYLRLNSDHQQLVYILREGETEPPTGMQRLLAQGNRLQDLFMAAFQQGLTGNELLERILARARDEGLPNPKVYSHSLGLFLHQPGPLIGLPWEQERNPGRGDVRLEYNNSFTMELSVSAPMAEWENQDVRLALEEDVVFTRDGCRAVDGRQTSFYVI